MVMPDVNANSDTIGQVVADYVVVGAGAMGMAFVDEILTHTDATVAMVERRNKPGGHWNDAYPYVRLHQPSYFYGLNSAQLGSDRIDEVGHNTGLSELASGAEVCAYFDQAMQRRYLPSGRVQFFPNTEYRDGTATVIPSGATFELSANIAVVDATYMKVTVPSTTPPRYEVADGATVIPPNQLPTCTNPAGGYVIIGAGKTAFDAITWLLDQQVQPDSIRWVVPRDSWMIDRAITQPGDGFRLGEQPGIIAEAESAEAMWLALEAAGHMLRIDTDRTPEMYRCATITQRELAELRRIDNVIRLGRVTRVGETSIDLEHGSVDTTPDTVHVDCTADGLERRPIVPVFDGDRITLQTVRACQQVFSAALIGFITSLDLTEAEKNELATVIPHPDTPADFVSGSLAHIHNVGRWSQNPAIMQWMLDARLSPTGGSAPDLGVAIAAAMKLEEWIAAG